MTVSTRIAALALLIIAATGDALADCTDLGIDTGAAYASAQAGERAGRLEDALVDYDRAAYVGCAGNPMSAPAAKRAAEIAKPLGDAAERRGNFAEASRFYELGGHYADSDRTLMADVRAHPDDPDRAGAALERLVTRGSPSFPDDYSRSFQANHASRLQAAGPYAQDPKWIAELETLVIRGIDRALEREAASFSEPYLRERVEIIRMRPDDLADVPAMSAAAQRQAAFEQKWQAETIQRSLAELRLALEWSSLLQTRNWDVPRKVSMDERVHERADERVSALLQRYREAPQSLEDALDYQWVLADAKRDGHVQQVTALAMKLGDEASAKGRLGLAHDYFEVAGNREKAQAASERQSQLAKQKLQPQIDDATRQAEALKAGFGSPANVEEIKKRAAEAQKALQKQRPDKQERDEKADELESELGL